ncbi:MAG: DEAD/DEAH box helicase [Methylococcaceae bacterium]|nr:DEAD/DEAH box helicase [Methylococcaceae bacterium]
MILDRFHPALSAWFLETFPAPTDCQAQAWSSIKEGRHTLIAAPTGSGKTLAAFLAAIDELVRLGTEHRLEATTQVLYISPLKALSNDIQKNLQQPLEGVNRKLFELGDTEVAIRSMVRTGDTPTVARTAMTKQPPHLLVTTPESLYILLTSVGGRRLLKTVRTVIVDEIHAILGSKRGSHLSLSLERLERLSGGRLVRIGLSATQKPITEVARFLVGDADCHVVDAGHMRQRNLAIELPDSPLEAVLSNEAAKSIHDRMAQLILEHRTTLIFVNNRRMAERLARALSERIGEDNISSHHGSLAREQRLSAECRLKEGKLKALVATASLELGIDIGDVDLVCQLGTTGSIATFLQRVGRSGHFAGGTPKGRLFPTSRDDLIECLALLDAIRRSELDLLRIPAKPLDVLAQQIVAMVACEDWAEDELFATLRRAWPYRDLERAEFDEVVKMLAEGFSTRRGLRGAYLHRDGIYRRLMARKGARLTAITCGGAIPDNAEYRVILEPSGDFIGTVDEDFAIESMAGDIFQLGNASWRLLKLETGILRVEDAQGLPPSIPFWIGEAPGRTHELSLAVSRLRLELVEQLSPPEGAAEGKPGERMDLNRAVYWLERNLGVSSQAAEQAVAYLAAAQAALGVMPSFDTVVFERFFDESGGMQFIIHAPFGSRLNRAWGLALRKRFCRGFNFELQAAATENAVILSLSTSHSFPLLDVAKFLNSNTVRDLLIQALLAAPMFNVRWRWNAVCSLALKRFQGGRKTQPYLLRMQAEDLVACIFPDQLACLENIVGDRQIPDHPLVHQTIEDCLTEAMDIDRLLEVIRGIETGRIEVVARDLVEPSPLAAEIVNSRVYSFLDGAPLEERRTRAVASRRWLDPSTAADLGRLDEAAIARVREEAWPQAGDREELHDALNVTGFIHHPEESGNRGFSPSPTQLHAGTTEEDLQSPPLPGIWPTLFAQLTTLGRAAALPLPQGELWIAAERWPQFRVLYPGLRPQPELNLPPEWERQAWEPEAALGEILRARLSALGPVETASIARQMALSDTQVEQALLKLEIEGFLLRGSFTQSPLGEGAAMEWCERRLLARIHRYTIDRLRQEIEPVSSADFMRFLFRWQRARPDVRGEGPDALASVLEQLEGFEAAAMAWESDILPSRIRDYDPAWLDAQCLSGKTLWVRLTPALSAQAPVKSSPIALLQRRRISAWRALQKSGEMPEISASARRLMETLAALGASFFEELADAAGLLKTQAEAALAELVAKGLAHADSFKGLRALLVPEDKKRRYKGISLFGIEDAGRWSLITPFSLQASKPPLERESRQTPMERDELANTAIEYIADVLLRRYGVMFRALLARESAAPAWQELLKVYRKREARGEIRGGRFVAGHYGEQFALPEAVEALRSVRKQASEDEICAIGAADPLNLVGIITPGAKLPALPGNRVLYKAGIPLAILSGKEMRWLVKPETEDEWDIKNRLIRRQMPPQLKAYW